MPIEEGWARVVLSGTLPGGEIFDTGFWMNATGVVDAASATENITGIAALLGSETSSGGFHTVISTVCADATVWTKSTGYYYPAGGPTAEFIGEYLLETPRSGLGASLPNQVSLVSSLRTGFSGRSNRGRMFIPGISNSALTSDGQLSMENAANVAAAWAEAFSAINASEYGKVIVASQQHGSARQVTSVVVDTRFDIQRKRANRQSIDGSSSQPVTV